MLKGTLGLRPNFHQLEKRVDGHIFISVLAYHLELIHKVVDLTQRASSRLPAARKSGWR